MKMPELVRGREMGIVINRGDGRLARFDLLCERAHARVEDALRRMGECHDTGDRQGWNEAIGDFDRSMKLYDLADEVLGQ